MPPKKKTPPPIDRPLSKAYLRGFTAFARQRQWTASSLAFASSNGSAASWMASCAISS